MARSRPGSAHVAREIAAYGRLAPQAARTRASRIAFALAFGDPRARARARAALDSLDPESATQVYMFLAHPRFARERETVFPAVDRRLDDRARATVGFWRFYNIGVTDGRVRQALTLLDDPGTPNSVRYCGPLGLSVRGMAVPEELLEETLSMSRADSSSFDSAAWVACAAAHAANRSRWTEHAALLSHAREIVRQEMAAGDSASTRQWDRVVREAQAHGLWRQGRTGEALRAFEKALLSDASASLVVWYVGQLSFELGQLAKAERAFDAIWGEPLAHLYLGRIYERTDRPAEALEAYDFFAFAWRDADPELQPLVQEARRAVTRLSGAEE